MFTQTAFLDFFHSKKPLCSYIHCTSLHCPDSRYDRPLDRGSDRKSKPSTPNLVKPKDSLVKNIGEEKVA